MRKILTFCLSFMILNSAYSYTPTLDSLLRNANNIDVGKNTVQANLVITEIDPNNHEVIKTDEGMIERQSIKLLLNNENETRPILTQVNYKGGVFSSDALINLINNNLDDYRIFAQENENLEGEAFYSVLTMLLNNDSKQILKFLRKHVGNIKKNEDLINKEKLNLLSAYKNYLVTAKEAKEEEVEIENPLKPADPEKRKEIREIKRRSFLEQDPMVKRVKLEDEFFWVVDERNLVIKFDNNHRILELKLKVEQGELEFTFGKFIIHSAQLEFPEFIWFKDFSGKKYLIKANKLTMFSDNLDAHRKRLKRYEKQANENKIVEPPVKPLFLL